MTVDISLLDLPVELRLAIYDVIIHLREDVVGRQAAGKNRRHTRFDPPVYLTSWCALMLVCRQVASELRYHMAKMGSNTWVIELENGHASPVPKPVRRCLPCSPTHLRALRVNTPLRAGSMPLTTALTLDRIISVLVRSGPLLNADVELSRFLRFESVELAFSWTDLHNMRYGLPEKIVWEFRRIQRSSSNSTHPLRSAIDNIKLVTDGYEQCWSLLGEDD